MSSSVKEVEPMSPPLGDSLVPATNDDPIKTGD
jgi:hypothetical protein